MSNRRKNREITFQIIYMSFIQEDSFQELMNRYLKENYFRDIDENYIQACVQGVFEKKEEIESWINELSRNWQIDRVFLVDRAILMLALYEMIYVEDIPIVVSINEAIELAKKFSSDQSKKFINGLLDKAMEKLKAC